MVWTIGVLFAAVILATAFEARQTVLASSLETNRNELILARGLLSLLPPRHVV